MAAGVAVLAGAPALPPAGSCSRTLGALMYQYRAKLLNVVDGDTVDLDIDLGCFVRIVRRCRLRGIDAPEMRGDDREEGKVAKEELERILTYSCDPQHLPIRTYLDRSDKYGRLLVDIECNQATVNEILVSKGLAVKMTG